MRKEGHQSRFNLRHIIHHLKVQVFPYISHDGIPGHVLRTSDNTTNTSSLLGWTDNTIQGRFELPGHATMTTHEESITLATDAGASVTRFADGSMIWFSVILRAGKCAIMKELHLYPHPGSFKKRVYAPRYIITQSSRLLSGTSEPN
jgi:hypothetical protein